MVKSRCAEPQRPGFKPGSARWGEGKGLQFLPQGVHSSEAEGARETERNTERSKGTGRFQTLGGIRGPFYIGQRWSEMASLRR